MLKSLIFVFLKKPLNFFLFFNFLISLNVPSVEPSSTKITSDIIFNSCNFFAIIEIFFLSFKVGIIAEIISKYYICKKKKFKLFHQISTDEVFGDSFKVKKAPIENSEYRPSSPYSASKASSDHFVRAYGETYEIPYVISNCSNNYGPNQFPEKLIPLFINNIINNKSLPVYGDGNYTRDWLFVEDHALAIDLVFNKGLNRETYNVGGFNEWKNIDLIKLLCRLMDEKLENEIGTSEKLITFIKDRPGHDFRYALDASKINKDLGWRPSVTFEEGLSKTIDWYFNNKEWLNDITSGEYQNYYKLQYK